MCGHSCTPLSPNLLPGEVTRRPLLVAPIGWLPQWAPPPKATVSGRQLMGLLNRWWPHSGPPPQQAVNGQPLVGLLSHWLAPQWAARSKRAAVKAPLACLQPTVCGFPSGGSQVESGSEGILVFSPGPTSSPTGFWPVRELGTRAG